MKWLLYALLSTSIYAFIPILDKMNCTRLDPMIVATISSILSSLILVGYCGVEGKFIARICNIDYIDGLYILGTGALTAISWAFYYGAIKLGPVSKITPFDSFSFVLTILFSSFILKEAIELSTLVGIMTVLFGMYIIVN